MVLLDMATATLHRLSKVTTFLLQWLGCNFECNTAACSRHPPYRIPMLILRSLKQCHHGVNKIVFTLKKLLSFRDLKSNAGLWI